MEHIKRFSEEFFKNLKCEVSWVIKGHDSGEPDEDILVVSNVPKGFEDLVGKVSPYRLCFVSGVKGSEFVGKGSPMFVAMMKYLRGSGETSLLKIDFDIDVEKEIRNRVGLKNCEIGRVDKSYRNSFFSRFSFVTSFNYLNESERILSEIYVRKGKIVEGDLTGYTVVDSKQLAVDSEQVKEDYIVAKDKSIELSGDKKEKIANVLKEMVESELARIEAHYGMVLKELRGDLNGKLDKIRSLELELRGCGDKERAGLRERVDKLRKGLVKAGDDEAVKRVMNERDLTIQDVLQKFSLNIDRKLVNTTVIYYPVYFSKIYLKSEIEEGVERIFNVEYDPLTKVFRGLDCEVCGKSLERISLCSNGHVACDDCLSRCGECGRVFCSDCLKKSCEVCGKKLCKDCANVCRGCGNVVCATHFRKDCVSGEERCVSCLRACLRCHGMAEERYFGEALDGSKVCLKCLGAEKMKRVLGKMSS